MKQGLSQGFAQVQNRVIVAMQTAQTGLAPSGALQQSKFSIQPHD
jgi:hypothetical protein